MKYLGLDLFLSSDKSVTKRALIFENEFWKEVPNYEGSYAVSSLCRVKSLHRLVRNRPIKGKLLNKQLDRYGYHYITFQIRL